MKLPRCRDPEERIYLDLAAVARAEALVTGDADLLALAYQDFLKRDTDTM